MKNFEIFVPFPTKESVEVLVGKLSAYSGVNIKDRVSSIKTWSLDPNYKGFTLNPSADISSVVFPSYDDAESFKENKKNNGGIVWI